MGGGPASGFHESLLSVVRPASQSKEPGDVPGIVRDVRYVSVMHVRLARLGCRR